MPTKNPDLSIGTFASVENHFEDYILVSVVIKWYHQTPVLSTSTLWSRRRDLHPHCYADNCNKK